MGESAEGQLRCWPVFPEHFIPVKKSENIESLSLKEESLLELFNI